MAKTINSKDLNRIIKDLKNFSDIIEKRTDELDVQLNGEFFGDVDEMDESNEAAKQPLIYESIKAIFDEMKQLHKNIEQITKD
jgi:hypothetical protein